MPRDGSHAALRIDLGWQPGLYDAPLRWRIEAHGGVVAVTELRGSKIVAVSAMTVATAEAIAEDFAAASRRARLNALVGDSTPPS